MEKTKTQSSTDVKINSTVLCFRPFDEEAELRFRALNILNQIKTIGFITRAQWFSEVFDAYPEMNTAEGFKTLQAFWNLRYFGIALMAKLEVLIDNLKEEA